MKQYVLALDLKNDPEKIATYIDWHQKVWPEVLESIRVSGILGMKIYRVSNRLVMMMDTTDEFDFGKKALADAQNPKVMEWERLMWEYQEKLPFAAEGEKWVLMDCIFEL